MNPSWTLRQVLATLRGLTLMIAIFWALILLQLVPALVRGGLTGVRDHIVRVATTGVPQEHWEIAISRMYIALVTTLAVGFILFLAQRSLGRKLASQGGTAGRS